MASLSGAGTAFPFLDTSAHESNGRFSPDGRWIAYASDETGQWEVHVRPFDGGPAGTAGRVQLSNDGGDFPVWGPDGRELFFVERESRWMVAAQIETEPTFNVVAYRELVEVPPDFMLARMGTYDVTPNGQRFLMGRMGVRGLVQVADLFVDLQRRLPN